MIVAAYRALAQCNWPVKPSACWRLTCGFPKELGPALGTPYGKTATKKADYHEGKSAEYKEETTFRSQSFRIHAGYKQ